jgi:glutathione peroxidase-family protein
VKTVEEKVNAKVTGIHVQGLGYFWAFEKVSSTPFKIDMFERIEWNTVFDSYMCYRKGKIVREFNAKYVTAIIYDDEYMEAG